MATISFQPFATTLPSDTFQKETLGFVQGTFDDDPSTNNWLLSGLIDSTETGIIYGGCALTEKVKADNNAAPGNNLKLATAQSNLTAFSVFNQAYNGLIVPGNSAPLYVAGMTTSYFRLGSNARIAVKCDPTFANTIINGNTNQQCSWDYTNQQLVAYDSTAALPVKILKVYTNSKLVSVDAGVLSWETGVAVLIQI